MAMEMSEWRPFGEALVTGEGLWFRQQYFSSPAAVRNQWFQSFHPYFGKTVRLFLHVENGSLAVSAYGSYLPCYPLPPAYARYMAISGIGQLWEQRKVIFLRDRAGGRRRNGRK